MIYDELKETFKALQEEDTLLETTSKNIQKSLGLFEDEVEVAKGLAKEENEYSFEKSGLTTFEENIENKDVEVNIENDTEEKKETVETNCLALTVRKDYSVSIIKNSIFTSIRLSLKVAISTFILNVLSILF